jgi:radical SAM-linked protein
VRAFERAFRRAQIEVVHSQGYNPRPKLSFSPPLRLGYTSEAEFVDIHVYEQSKEIIKDNLNKNLPDGIDILDITPVNSSVPSLMASIEAMEYQIDMTENQISETTIDKLLKEPEISVSRKVKGKIKTIDIRPFIDQISRKGQILTVKTKSIDGRTVRINELLSNLFTDHRNGIESLPVHKTRQFIKMNGSILTPMDIH